MRAGALAVLLFAPAVAGAGDPSAGAPFAAEEIKATLRSHVAERVREGGGVFRVPDQAGGELLLEFEDVSLVADEAMWRIHDPARPTPVDARGYFGCATFHLRGAPPGKRYDVDFRLVRQNGRLEVAETLVHREARLVGGQWTWVERYSKEKLGTAPIR